MVNRDDAEYAISLAIKNHGLGGSVDSPDAVAAGVGEVE